MTSMNKNPGDVDDRLIRRMPERESMAKLLPRLAREYDVASLKAVSADYSHISAVRLHDTWGMRFVEAIDVALEGGRITEEEADAIDMSGIVAWGRRRVERTRLWFSVHAAATIGNDVVERAAKGAAALRKVTGEDAAAVVYGRRIADQQWDRAGELGVAVMLDEDGGRG